MLARLKEFLNMTKKTKRLETLNTNPPEVHTKAMFFPFGLLFMSGP